MSNQFTKLYKMGTKSKIMAWSIEVGKDSKGHYYEMTHGQKGGKMQTARTYIKSGKNIGRKNETTAEQQCLAEATSKHTYQIERKGYSTDEPSSVPFKPMLAKVYSKEIDKVIFPCVIQPKLDGIRCLALIKKDGVQLLSRTSNEFSGLDHILKELEALHPIHGDLVLDGELFNPILSFQTITSLCRKSKNLSDESSQIQYWVYDMISEKDFHQRFLDWSNIIGGLTNVRPTATHIIKSEADIVSYHKQFTSQGYEGSMIRNLNSPYKINGRSSDLLKYKDFDDNEFKIVGYEHGTGKFENVPTFKMVTKEGYPFDGVPAGTEEQRAQYLRDAKSYLGELATVRFFGYTTTDEPVPRFPVIIELGRKLDNEDSQSL